MEWLALTLLVLGLFGAAILRRHLREAKLLRLREISHKERMMAMEHNLPAPESDAARLDALLSEAERNRTGPDRISGASVHWIRLICLALGLTCLFGGAGVMLGLYPQADPEAQGMWPIGMIPVFIGVGLLIFIGLSKGMAEKLNGRQERR